MSKIIKKPKARKLATAHQFDEALMAEINHVSLLNVPRNAISSAVMFCMAVGNRLYGQRPQEQRTAEFHATLLDVIEKARIERETAAPGGGRPVQAKSNIIIPGRE